MRRHLTGWPARLAPHLVFLVPELLMAAGPFVISSIARTMCSVATWTTAYAASSRPSARGWAI